MITSTNLNFEFTGDLNLKYKGFPVNASKALFDVRINEENTTFDMTVFFDKKSLIILSKYLLDIKQGLDKNIFTYNFSLNKKIIEKYKKEFDNVYTFEEVMSIGNYACMKLENYDLK